MAEESKGPYLIMASFCEKVLQERDDVFTAIRLVDTLQLLAMSGEKPDEMPAVTIRAYFLVRFASENLTASREFRLFCTNPSEEKKQVVASTIYFEESGLGVNINVTANLGLKAEGVYWFDVYLDEEHFAHVPLKIAYMKAQIDEMK